MRFIQGYQCSGSRPEGELPTSSQSSQSSQSSPIKAGLVCALLAGTLGLSACGGGSSEAESEAEPAAKEIPPLAERPASFEQCAVCHSMDAGVQGLGPSLAGIYGRKAGMVEGFQYSTAMKQSNITWDDTQLDLYLADPNAAVNGTNMAFAGEKDQTRRHEIIGYLKAN